jgi:hypothetical protein
VQATVLALWLTSQLRPSPARSPSPDADGRRAVAPKLLLQHEDTDSGRMNFASV